MVSLPFRIVRKSEIEELQKKLEALEAFTKYAIGPQPGGDRPTGIEDTVRVSELAYARQPLYPVPLAFLYEIYKYSDIIRNIVRTLRDETFKNGLEVRPRFVVKCTNPHCEKEFAYETDTCDECGSPTRTPNEQERLQLEEFIKDVNYNDQPLIDVLKEMEIDLDITDNAFLLVRKEYFFDSDGSVVGARIREVLRASPQNMRLVMDKTGRPAYTDNGKILKFCLEHRDKAYEDRERCPKCGKKMYPAYYMAIKKGGEQSYFANGEVLHVTKYTTTMGYGWSPLFAVWRKAITLILIERYLYQRYLLQRSPKGLLVMRTTNFEGFERAWNWLMAKTKENPHLIYPLVIEGETEKGGKIGDWFDFSRALDETEILEVMNTLRLHISATYGVMPIYTGEVGGGGLANEGLQMTVTNRTIKMAQQVFNEKVLPFLVRQIGTRDYEIVLREAEERDEQARLDMLSRKIDIAERMRAMGFGVEIVQGPEGEIDFRFTEPEEREIPLLEEEEGRVSAGRVFGFQGEPEHGRPSRYEQRFGSEPYMPRKGESAVTTRATGAFVPRYSPRKKKPVGKGERVIEVSARLDNQRDIHIAGIDGHVDKIVIEAEGSVMGANIGITNEAGEQLASITDLDEGANVITPRKPVSETGMEMYYASTLSIVVDGIERPVDARIRIYVAG